MANVVAIEAESRLRAGKGAARATRREGKVPGVVYGGHAEPTLIALDPRVVLRELHRAGWQLEQTFDFTSHYLRWYRHLCERIRFNKERITAGYGEDWYKYTSATYENLREAVENGSIGGAVYRARRA